MSYSRRSASYSHNSSVFIAKPVTGGLFSISQKALEAQLAESTDAVSAVQYSGLFKIVSPMLSAFIVPFVFISLWIFTGIIMFIVYKVVSHAVATTDNEKNAQDLTDCSLRLSASLSDLCLHALFLCRYREQ